MRNFRSVLAGIGVIGLATLVPVGPSNASAVPPIAGPVRAALAAAPPAGVNLSFDEAQAVAANGTIIGADELTVCGDDTGKRFLAELLGDALNYKIPYRLGDVTAGAVPTADLGGQKMMSGTVVSDVFGTGDFPFDHPGASDFNMDVEPDAPYTDISQLGGVPSGHPMHTELAEAWIPHLPSAPSGPATGMTWEDNSNMARQDVHPGYLPSKGDRVIVMGRWVNDCGHPPFQTELHPISFIAWAHTELDTTVADSYYAPYREMEQYNIDFALSDQVNDPTRTNDQYTMPFPQGLIGSILRIQNALPGVPEIDHLESWGLLEAVNEPPADWWVCAPTGTSGNTLDVNYDFRARPGVVITATPDPATGCARMHVDLTGNTVPEPVARVCTLPWDWLSQVAADEAGVPSLDLKEVLKGYVADPYKSRIDPDPIMDCYDPLKGAPVNPTPTGQNVTVDSTISQPFYGRVAVSWSTSTPGTTSTSSSSTSTSTSTSSSTTTPTGQSLTLTPSAVAAGGAIQINSGGWMPDTPVVFALDDATVLGTIQTDRFGVAAGSFTIPSATAVGAHEVVATGASVAGQSVVRSSVTVLAAAATTPPPSSSNTTGTLPTTGASIAGAIALASVLLLVGAGVLGLVRLIRRRPLAATPG